MSTSNNTVLQYNEPHKQRSYFLLLLPIGLTVLSLIGYIIFYNNVIPSLSEFDSLFKEGAMLVPSITTITLAFAPYSGILFLLSLISCTLSIIRHNVKDTKHALLLLLNGVGALIPFLLYFWLLFVTYLPVLNMEAQI